MSNLDPEIDNDPWLTVAEIAEELRVNPATVRLWVSKGHLPATRAGQRKLLIRRSDLNRVILPRRASGRVAGRIEPRPRDPQHPNWVGPPRSIRELSTADVHGYQVDAEEMQEIIEDLRSADEAWDTAQAASENAPPDPGFASRDRALATACEQQGESLATAARIEGFSWTARPGQRHMVLSHELRPGANRPGPATLWDDFDRAVQRLGIAMEGSVMYVVAFQYRDLAEVMHRIADALLGETSENRDERD